MCGCARHAKPDEDREFALIVAKSSSKYQSSELISYLIRINLHQVPLSNREAKDIIMTQV